MVEKSAFKVQRARTRQSSGKGAKPGVLKYPEKSADAADLEEGQEYQKKVEKALRLRDWLMAEGCRRDVTDAFFHNPKRMSRECL